MAKKQEVKVIRRGFQGFGKPKAISKDDLKNVLDRLLPGIDGHYIYWTGNTYNFRRPSLRSNALRCVRQKKTPVKVSTWLSAVAHSEGEGIGWDPSTALAGLRLHRKSKPSVYFELKKDAKGNFVSVNDVPYADGYPKGLKAGQIVVSAAEAGNGKQLPAKGKAAATRLRQEPSEQPSAPPANETEQPQG